MGFIFSIVVFLFILYLFSYHLLEKHGNRAFIFLIVFSLLLGLILAHHTEEAGEHYPFTEIHLADNKGNVYEIIKMKDGEEVERIIIDESGKRKVVEKSSKSS